MRNRRSRPPARRRGERHSRCDDRKESNAEVDVAFRAHFLRQAMCVLALSMVSCGDIGSRGELGNGGFGYLCLSDGDPVCKGDPNFVNSYMKALPAQVAVGSRFGIGFLSESSTALDGTAVVQAVSSQLLSGSSDAFKAEKAGYAGILAKRGSSVVDVRHIRIVDVNALRIHVSLNESDPPMTGITSLEIGMGALVTLSFEAAGAMGEVLSGSLDAVWSSTDPDVAAIQTSSAAASIVVRGGEPGQAMIQVTSGGVSAAIPVKVTGGAQTSGGSGGSGSGGSGGGAGGAGGGS